MADLEDGAEKRIGLVPMWVFTTSIFMLNSAVDAGLTFPPDEMQKLFERGEALEMLATQEIGGRVWLSELSHEDLIPHRIVLSELLAGVGETIDARRKMGVENNGICLALAFMVEALQQWGDARKVRP